MVERSIRYSDPSASRTVTGPFTRYGPFSVGVMVTAASVMPLVYNTPGRHSDRQRANAGTSCSPKGFVTTGGWLQSAKTSRESWTKNVWSWPLAVSALLYLAFGVPLGTCSSA